jgi:hypothetical protein
MWYSLKVRTTKEDEQRSDFDCYSIESLIFIINNFNTFLHLGLANKKFAVSSQLEPKVINRTL